MDKLHSDILESILFRLPIKPALQAGRVCKTWKNLLANRRYNGFFFAFRLANEEIQLYYGEQYDRIHVDKMNYYYSYKELIKLKHVIHGRDLYKDGNGILVGSCNGLVCFRIGDELDSFMICNPLTGEVVLLPDIRLRWSLRAFGFGYCHSTNDYKVVRMSGYYWEIKVVHVQVCTIGSGWRSIISIPYNLHGNGTFFNGALHWLDYDKELECKTVAFDVEDEKFRLLRKPPSEVRFCGAGNVLGLLGGNLCLVHTNLVDLRINIWAYKKNNNIKGHDQKSDYYNNSLWNWNKEFSIKKELHHRKPFAITKSNEVLLWCSGSILYCYDPTTSTLNKLWDDDNGMRITQAVAIPHTNSLVSLKELVENVAGDYKYYKTYEAVTTNYKDTPLS